MPESQQRPLFQDATHLIEDNTPSKSRGVSVFDIDEDGTPEILVANYFEENKVYKWNRGRFEKQQINGTERKSRPTRGFHITDFFGTGDPCIYMMQGSHEYKSFLQVDILLIKDSAAGEKVSFKALKDLNGDKANSFSTLAAASFDPYGFGKYRLLVSSEGSSPVVYCYNVESDEIERVTEEHLSENHMSPGSLVTQQIISDGKQDLYFGVRHNQDVLFRQGREGHFEEISDPCGITNYSLRTKNVCVSDLDGTGEPSLIINAQGGPLVVLNQLEDGSFDDMTPPLFQTFNDISHIICADFDNDGKEELLLTRNEESNLLFRYLGTGTWEDIPIGDLKLQHFFCQGVAIGDFTGNGVLDLFLSHGDRHDEINCLFLGEENENSSLRVQPLTQYGFPALGAKVRLFSKGKHLVSRTKYLCSESSNLTQHEPVAHFGLGTYSDEVDYLEVIWPGGLDSIYIAKVENVQRFLGKKGILKIPHPLTQVEQEA